MDATMEEVTEPQRREWLEDTLTVVMLMMKRKYNHPEMTDFNIISFEENNVLVEFPSLKDQTKKDIE